MTKLALLRSCLRRRVLTKCADDYSKAIKGYTDSQHGFMGSIMKNTMQDMRTRNRYMPKMPSAVGALANANRARGVVSGLGSAGTVRATTPQLQSAQ